MSPCFELRHSPGEVKVELLAVHRYIRCGLNDVC
jgi:hypothetical protein